MSEHLNEISGGAEPLTEDGTLQYTQRQRLRLIGEMTKNGTMPDDNKSRVVLLTALKDMDSQAVKIKQIGAKERQGHEDRQAVMMMAKIFGRLDAGSGLARPAIDGQATRVVPDIDEIGMEPLNLVPGETEVGVSNENYESFMNRMEGPGKA